MFHLDLNELLLSSYHKLSEILLSILKDFADI